MTAAVAARGRRVVTAVGTATALAALGAVALGVAGHGSPEAVGRPAAQAVGPVSSSGASGAGATHGSGNRPGAFEGTDAVGYVVGDRSRAVSRDSDREAMADAAEKPLKAATEEKGAETNAALKSLGRAAEQKAATLSLDRWQLPVGTYTLTARFGQAGGRWVNNHTGLDFAAPTGTPIVAVTGGTITQAGPAGAYGNRTVETLEDGTELYYCHQSAIQVRPGQKVVAGQRIGLVGATGNVTGPHLHLEVRPGGGDPVDPFQALVHHGLKP